MVALLECLLVNPKMYKKIRTPPVGNEAIR